MAMGSVQNSGSSIEDILDSIPLKKLKAKRKEIQDAILMNMSRPRQSSSVCF